jgi:hypothetical protein
MALLEDTIGAVFESGAATGLAIGAGVILLAPGLVPAIGKALRPLAKGAIKGGLYCFGTDHDRCGAAAEETCRSMDRFGARGGRVRVVIIDP